MREKNNLIHSIPSCLCSLKIIFENCNKKCVIFSQDMLLKRMKFYGKLEYFSDSASES